METVIVSGRYPADVAKRLEQMASTAPTLVLTDEAMGTNDLEVKSSGLPAERYSLRTISLRERVTPAPAPGEVVLSWTVTDQAVFTADGRMVRRNLSAYAMYVGGDTTGDICPYCGCDNVAPDGTSWRQGYSCCNCGGS